MGAYARLTVLPTSASLRVLFVNALRIAQGVGRCGIRFSRRIQV